MTSLIPNNLLSIDQQSSDTAAGWSAEGTNTTLSWDQVRYRSAPGSVKMVATAAGDVRQKTGYGLTSGDPVGENLQLQVYTHVYSPANWTTVAVVINWINSSGTNISQTNVTMTGTIGANAWQRFTSPTVTSPAGTKDAQIVISTAGLGAGQVVNTDDTYFGILPLAEGPTILRREGSTWIRRKLLRKESGMWVWGSALEGSGV